ncbi:hypothetical protein [Thiobacillus denitrificans]|uniref:hypothetical protein n=1 Tax=Thiobacillus denitrificans TaxID=36861 RepID=UPI0012F8A3E9|nr:hypothetical protein [Thiobacillus denitrificans]
MRTIKVCIPQPGWKRDGDVDYLLAYPDPPTCVIKAGVRVRDINTDEPFAIHSFQATDKGLVVVNANDDLWARVDEVKLA